MCVTRDVMLSYFALLLLTKHKTIWECQTESLRLLGNVPVPPTYWEEKYAPLYSLASSFPRFC